MLRTFDEHGVRSVRSLDGLWDFVIESERRDKAGRGRNKAALPKRYNRRIGVPGAWETMPGLEDYRGVGWLRRSFDADGRPVRLVFGGVSHTADVYVDGEHVAHHYDAFTPFQCIVTGLAEGEHQLVVRVDNTFGEHSALHKENDYYTYGGITRPVEIQMLDEVYVAKLEATPRRAGKTWSLDLAVTLGNLGEAPDKRRVVVQVGDYLVDCGETTVKPGAAVVVHKTLDNLDIDPWTADQPNLYLVEVLLLVDDEVADDKVDRIGFREVSIRGKKLLINGDPVRLRGYNRHEDHPQFGCALPVEAMLTDLNLLRDLGCNFVRTCHYPNDMRFLDLCDELGFYVWEETHSRAIAITGPVYREQIDNSAKEMIGWHANRPSIIIWGCLNECRTETAAGAREHGRVLKLMKKLDPTRPVTYASNRAERDRAYKHADIISWNRYDNWYGEGLGEVRSRIDAMLKWLDGSASTGGQGKPVIMSEFGAGAIYGWRMPHHDRWTEEYQAEALDECLRAYLEHPEICGVAIWQFCDVRLTRQWWSGRPRNMNNKGTVDEYRRPKLAYAVVQRRLRAAARKRR